jgi:ABC-type transporter Mla subunit MlaD
MSQMDNIEQTIKQINQNLEGTIAHIENLNRKIEDSSKMFMESIAEVNENMRLIIEVIKKQRSNTKDDLNSIKKTIKEEIDKLWNEKMLQTIVQDELNAIGKLKDINVAISDNLYMAQMLAIIQSLREISGRAMAIKLKKEGK